MHRSCGYEVRPRRGPMRAPMTCLVLAVEITFQHQPIVAQYDEPVQVPDAFVGNGLVEPGFEIRRKACVPQSDRLQSIGGRAE